MRKLNLFILAILLVLMVNPSGKSAQKETFPDFITANSDYYITRIGKIPKIDPDAFRLKVSGLIDAPKTLTLDELYAKPMLELPLTVECIGNSPNGQLVSTAIWKGFSLYEFLVSLGLNESATGVRYVGADGYYASHTLEQVKSNNVLIALYMNGEPIPPLHGFPIRILSPGFYGVKQPAWVESIEVIGRPIKDYWEDRGWDCSPPMAVDSQIFFPKGRMNIQLNRPFKIGGAAFGGQRISRVEVTTNGGRTWKKTDIVKSLDADNVWVFWQANLVIRSPGVHLINVRATDIQGNTQHETDPEHYDGRNDWPLMRIKINR